MSQEQPTTARKRPWWARWWAYPATATAVTMTQFVVSHGHAPAWFVITFAVILGFLWPRTDSGGHKP